MVESLDEKRSTLDDASPTANDSSLNEDEANGEKLQKHTSGAAQNDIVQGGTKAWLQVLGGFFAFINIWHDPLWGFPLCYGVFQNFYTVDYLRDKSESSVAWVGTVQNFLVSMVSVLSGPIYDLGYYRTLVLSGSFLSTLGIMMLSLSTQYYQLFLSHICNGVGSGLLYVPTLALVAQGHTKTRSLAMGIVAGGIALGGIIYTIIFLKLQPSIGFPWAIRTIGFLVMGLYLAAIPLLLAGGKAKVSGKARRLFDLSALRTPAWLAYTAAQSMSFWGYLVPMFYIPTFATVVLHQPASTGAWLLVAVQGASLFGRLGAGLTAHYVGVMAPLVTCIFISGVLSLAWLGIHDLGGYAVYCTLYGLFSGALIALPPSIFPSVCERTEVQGTWMGMAWATTSLASLTGAPIAGSLVNLDAADMTGAQIWAGVVLLVASGFLCLLWTILARKKKKVWI
ncbi:MAG: hypothetical protein Q9162_001853 [Coniocarpon cinnabarinum]